jgi:hypothetical protein
MVQVYLDGALLGAHRSGYTPFAFALGARSGPARGVDAPVAFPAVNWFCTPRSYGRAGHLSIQNGGVPGPGSPALLARLAASDAAPLLLAVRADATRPDGWWYDGGGIYRSVRLVVLPRQVCRTIALPREG